MRRSPEQIAEIAKLWQEGKSARQIGEMLGVTRNVVIGLVHRNAIKREGNPITEAMIEQRRAAGSRGGVATAEKRKEQPRKPEKPVVVPKKQPFTPIEATDFWRGSYTAESLSPDGPKSLMDLTWSDCRFPLGKFNQSPTGFCGATKKFGSSFCAAHHFLVYRGTVAQIEAQRRKTEEERRRKKQREARQAVAS